MASPLGSAKAMLAFDGTLTTGSREAFVGAYCSYV